ncbi:hypothetical protein F503_07090 [Ophiostoma piceae UAMH 11346]|uniref:Uncharacterized protein n=1 Tax=Ophiostoma piceae (strain UAMH 11346) TaxID=1262450 RepID=S3C714_OPHP1|nr:hypothetical protein F503_07090 [Ophiostoma piceae UAMH 11346]
MASTFRSTCLRWLVILGLLALLFAPAEAAGQGACVKRPDPAGPNQGDLYSMRIANGLSHAEEHGESPNRPGRYYFDALRKCHPKDFVAVYDSQGNAHLSFVIKDKKRSNLPLKGANRNTCDVGAIISQATNGAYEPECVFGGADKLAAQWTKSQTAPAPAAKAPYEQ